MRAPPLRCGSPAGQLEPPRASRLLRRRPPGVSGHRQARAPAARGRRRRHHGDLTHFGDPPDAWRVVEAVRAHCPRVLAVTGNLDMPAVIDAFHAAGISLHGEGRRLESIGLFGCGGSNLTPMDTPTELEDDAIAAVLERG